MSPDDKPLSSAKKAKPLIAAREGSKSPVARVPRTGEVKNVHKSMAAIATANGTNPPPLSEKHKKLLDRQALLIETMQDFGRNVSSASNTQTPGQSAPKLPSKSSIQELAKRVGIWTPSGKLSSSYKK